MLIVDWIKQVGLSGFFDIAIMSVLIYSILVWMKRTKRAAAVITGILIVAVAFLLARQFGLKLTTAILQGFFAVILVALIVIFQEELRYFFEKVTHWSLNKGLPGSRRKSLSFEFDSIDILAGTLTDLARERIGALVVIRGKDLIDRHLTNCEPLNGVVSEKILKSIFDPHSTGHDGAVVLENQTIKSFGCHLPLSKKIAQLNISGTRHAAALGLAELTDALCLVVSEERGTVSVARHGKIDELPEPEGLSQVLEPFYQELKSDQESAKWTEFFRRNYRQKALAFGLALALWFVLVHESRTVYRTYDIPLRSAELFSGLMVTQIEPENVAVTLSGQRKSFYFLNEDDIKLNLKQWQLGAGKSTVRLTGSDFAIPEGLEYENAIPRDVTVTIASQSQKNGDSK